MHVIRYVDMMISIASSLCVCSFILIDHFSFSHAHLCLLFACIVRLYPLLPCHVMS